MVTATAANAQSLQRAQAAPAYLKAHSSTSTPFPVSLIYGAETAEQWQLLEKYLIACLKVGDDRSAHLCLEQLGARFGLTNEKVMGLRGLYQEATSNDISDLEKVLHEYEEVLEKSPANMVIAKRRVSVLKNLSRTNDAIKALVSVVEMTPTDAESWAELSDLYVSVGLAAQALYCLEQVLLVTPNAWNIHARLGEVLYVTCTSDPSMAPGESIKLLSESMKRYCRSVELCDGYLRGYCGLKLVTDRIMALLVDSKSNVGRNADIETVQVKALNQKATKSISRRLSLNESQVDNPDLIAAKAILDGVL